MLDDKEFKIMANITGETIRIGRKSMLKSQKEFARMIGISHTHLGDLERGNSLPSSTTLFKLRSILGLDIDKLFDKVTNEIEKDRDEGSGSPSH